MISRIFVYGTLKQLQCRAHLWPCEPLSICGAWTLGTLFDRHDYPALRPGNDPVLGECWSFQDQQIEDVLQTLDVIEGSNQPGQLDLYRRVEVQVWRFDQSSPQRFDDLGMKQAMGHAYTYHYGADPLKDGFIKMTRDPATGMVCWPKADSG